MTFPSNRPLYEGNDTGLGYPILARWATALAYTREPFEARAGGICAVPACDGVLSPVTVRWGLCLAHLEQLPEDADGARAVLMRTYRPGARTQSEVWHAALAAALTILAPGGP
jgi:hypothetical protein